MPATERSPRSQRWDIIGRYKVFVDGKLFIDRLRLLQNPLFAVLLTRIHGPDGGRDPHNHSRSFITICLTGSYTEVRHHPRHLSWTYKVKHRRFVPYYVPHWEPHQITSVSGKVCTLVFAGWHHGTFFFFTGNEPVDWKDYGK